MQGVEDGAVSLLTLIDLEVLRAHVEIVLLALCEVEAVSIDGLRILLSTSNSWLLRGRCC